MDRFDEMAKAIVRAFREFNGLGFNLAVKDLAADLRRIEGEEKPCEYCKHYDKAIGLLLALIRDEVTRETTVTAAREWVDTLGITGGNGWKPRLAGAPCEKCRETEAAVKAERAACIAIITDKWSCYDAVEAIRARGGGQ